MVDLPDVLDLTAPQARVLGCLIEKQLTTPDAYPLTLKALTAACNQTSNRDPVVQYEAQLVETTTLALKGKGLARVVHPGSGERATRYRQVADEALALDPAERALLCLLLVRGAQTVVELRTRSERLHAFATPSEVEAVLERMAGGERPLVARVERQPGQKEHRWIQLLEVDAERRAAWVPNSSVAASARSGRVEELESRVEQLERRLSALESALDGLIELPADSAPPGPADPTGV
jgi:uncharacterized protein YceH (UPF0502 family)